MSDTYLTALYGKLSEHTWGNDPELSKTGYHPSYDANVLPALDEPDPNDAYDDIYDPDDYWPRGEDYVD